MNTASTICAISTPPGTGGIAVIRVSGQNAFSCVNKFFVPRKKDTDIFQQSPYTLNLGSFMNARKETIDDVLIGIFRAPHSYTGEDVVEISCHGSAYIQQQILQTLIDAGCSLAKPGEFTQRAFLNKKMDLSQAEAVADLIAADSAASHRMALNQMRGGISEELKNLRTRLLDFVSLTELELDFSEEDVEFADRSQLMALANEIEELILKLSNSFKVGNALKNGIPVAIVGETNVGK